MIMIPVTVNVLLPQKIEYVFEMIAEVRNRHSGAVIQQEQPSGKP